MIWQTHIYKNKTPWDYLPSAATALLQMIMQFKMKQGILMAAIVDDIPSKLILN